MSGLRPWKKGQSGNPKGRPKSLPDLPKLLAEVLGGYPEGKQKTVMQEILEELARDAKAKDSKTKSRSAEILIERAYGKTKDADKSPEDTPQKITGFKFK